DPWVATDHPAASGGDVGGTDDVAVAAEPAERTAEGSPPGLGDLLPAERTGRGGPPLVHLDHPDARQLGLVLQSCDEMRAAPGAGGIRPADPAPTPAGPRLPEPRRRDG